MTSSDTLAEAAARKAATTYKQLSEAWNSLTDTVQAERKEAAQ